MKAELWHEHARENRRRRPAVMTVEQLRGMSPSARRREVRDRRLWMRGQQYDWPQKGRLERILTECVEDNEVLGHGAKDIVALDALNGVGKSTLVRSWAMGLYKEIIGTAVQSPQIPVWEPRPGVRASHVPIVWVNLGSATSIKDFNTAILAYLGYPVDGTIRALNQRIYQAIDLHRVRVLIVDDAHLLETGAQQGRDVLDHIKHVNTELGERDGTIILVGARLADHPILKDPQIRNRLRYERIKAMGVDTAEARAAWQGFLYGIEQAVLPLLPAAQPGLLAGRHAPHIWRRTQGFVGDVAELVTRAALSAAEDDLWTITPKHVEEAELKERAEREALDVARRARKPRARRSAAAA